MGGPDSFAMASLVPRRSRLIAGVGVGLLASGLVAGWSATAGAACPPVAIVEGAAEIVAPVAAVLRRRGVRSEPSGCGRVVRASLATSPGVKSYSLHIEDGYGRVSNREIADAGTAASLIESWAVDEDADVLAPRAAPIAIAHAPETPTLAAAGGTAGFGVAILGEVSTASDGSVWYGGGAGACGRVGLICLGGRARIARDAGNGSGVLAGSLSRTRIDGALTASVPLSRGAFTFAPALGVGLYWTRSTIDELAIQEVQVQIPIDMAADDLAVGVEASLAAAYAVSAHWSLVAALGGVFANRVSTRAAEWDRLSTVPTPPRGFVHLGTGLQYGF
jgi:hypothetical protein